jgi:hypothetical protein
MGRQLPKRGDYEYIKKKAEDVFYDPKVATKELIDEVYESVNDRIKLIKNTNIAKSAIRHNMAKDLPKMHVQTYYLGKMIKLRHQMLQKNSINYYLILPYIGSINGHAAMMEHPEEFNRLLEDWLTHTHLSVH